MGGERETRGTVGVKSRVRGGEGKGVIRGVA